MENNLRKCHVDKLVTITVCLFWCVLLLIFAVLFISTKGYAANSDGSIDVQFKGTLSEGACVLDPQSEVINVSFPDVAAKFFSRYEKGPERKFQIRLGECELGRTVKVQFRGTPATAAGLEGSLKLTSVTSALADQLGLQLVEYVEGQPKILSLNGGLTEGTIKNLTQTAEVLNFGAWLKPSMAVRSGTSVTPGEYRAVVTFDLIYD